MDHPSDSQVRLSIEPGKKAQYLALPGSGKNSSITILLLCPCIPNFEINLQLLLIKHLPGMVNFLSMKFYSTSWIQLRNHQVTQFS